VGCNVAQIFAYLNQQSSIWQLMHNAPNKFMGARMLPAGAYVTLEHEYILVFRKRGKRVFKSKKEKVSTYL
jgi:modification methylase